AAALIKQVNPGFTPSQIMQIMRDSANWIYDSYTGQNYPQLNVNGAITLAYQRSGTAPVVTPVTTPTPVVTTPAAASGTPYSGAAALAGTILKASWYDAGGEGVGYHDTTSWNESGLVVRDGVDIGYTNADG